MKPSINSCENIARFPRSSILIIVLLSAILVQHILPQDRNNLSPPALPESFPAGTYTPHGYLDNPWHSMVFNRSGIIRSFPPLGMGFWKRKFFGSYAEGPRGHINYLSLLQFSFRVDGTVFLTSRDFERNKVNLYSAYHTKNLMSYDWEYAGIQFHIRYFLPFENSLVALIEIHNPSSRLREIELHAGHIYGEWELPWWGSDGLTGRYLPEQDALVSKIWAYGDVFLLSADWHSRSHFVGASQNEWRKWQQFKRQGDRDLEIIKGSGPLWEGLRYEFHLPPGKGEWGLVYLCRGKNEGEVLEQFRITRDRALDVLKKRLAEDDRFWSAAPVLKGDWPESWKNGWVYDFETLRMNVRPPLGIFKHPWDGMQVHSPRLVLGETALDMLTLSYADPGLAKEVLYGTFADALAPNVPCAREDGSVNMIGADGSECGTAPMWGFPFHGIQAIYAATGDMAWIERLYPHLKSYVDWWLANRTDAEGWLHCNNSWESGQDGSRRFLVKGEGDPATFVRTVDVEASMAEAMRIMHHFAILTGHHADTALWKQREAQRVRNTRSMFVRGWFRDFDGRNNRAIILPDYIDVMMLAPLTGAVALPEQVAAVRPKFQYFLSHPQWLQWPPALYTFCEAAWNGNASLTAATAVAELASRVYRRTDSPTVAFRKGNDPFHYRIPGVANEFWPVKDEPPGAENYGWGATLPLHLIRTLIGFREGPEGDEQAFFLAPAIPPVLFRERAEYQITNLHYRNLDFDLRYRPLRDDSLDILLQERSEATHIVEIIDREGNSVWERRASRDTPQVRFRGRNGERYRLLLEK